MEMIQLQAYTRELIATGVLLVLLLIFRVATNKLVLRYSKSNLTIERRSALVIKYIHLFLYIIATTALIIIWGVQTNDIIWALSSVTTLVGVALFAQWSILSNITAGIILFFSFPFKIGDVIKIHDKDFPITAEIEDITAFHVILSTKDGEQIVYPNNLLLQKGISILKDGFSSEPYIE
ncbi:small-conductance mechanosensitive channel [Flavobacterium sp. PL11]|jgi:small-conductance mechanosensitive channel|nr:small-conductance mechanosensitive channel [Flavobacterium sp. PL11]